MSRRYTPKTLEGLWGALGGFFAGQTGLGKGSDRRMQATGGGHRGKGASGHKSMERCHQITRNQSEGRGGLGHALSRKGHRLSKPSLVLQLKEKPVSNRTRPTNNQLLYKAYFRWHHFGVPTSCLDGDVNLPAETDACASVTAAFLQVLHGLQEAERAKPSKTRNVLMMLAHDTRHTKVVDLASATHRVSDELKRHCLMDDDQHQYTTNLDRNRYGNDDQYMFTVIRYNLCRLDLCPCLVDVEVLDQKSNESILVSAGADACMCQRCERSQAEGADKPRHSISRSERLDALIEAATRDTVNEASSANGSPLKNSSVKVTTKSRSMSTHSGRKHQVSGGEVDSLQHAINAFNVDPSFTDATRDSSKKLVPKRSFSSYQPVSKHMEGSVSDLHMQWGRAETVEDNVRGMESATGEAQPVAIAGVTCGKREREVDQEDPTDWVRQGRCKFGKQDSSTGSRSATAAEVKRLHAEVTQLCAEGRRNKEEFLDARREMAALSAFKRDFDEDRSRWRKVEKELQGLRNEVRRLAADRVAHEEKSHAAETQLAENRQVINILLDRLYQLLMANQAQTIRGTADSPPTSSISSMSMAQTPESLTIGQASTASVVHHLPQSRHPPISGVDHLTQVQLPPSFMLALAGQHVPGHPHNQLSASLLPNVTRVQQKHTSILECGHGGLRGCTNSKQVTLNGQNSLDLGSWNHSRSNVMDQSTQHQLEVPTVVVRNID